MTVGLFWLTIFFVIIGFAVLPFWNAVFVLMASFLGSLWAVSHYVDESIKRSYVDRLQRQALDKAIEGIHEAEKLENIYLRNLFYGVALAITGSSNQCNNTSYLSKLYEAKYNEPMPIPVHPKHN